MTARRSEIELRAGIDPSDGLMQERHRLVERVARLRPLFGRTEGWELKRGIELARLKSLIRARATGSDAKPPTVDQVDTEAHAHPEYLAFVEQGLTLAQEWAEAEEQLKAIDMNHNRDQALLRVVASENRL